MNDYWNSVKHITLPVKRVDGHWELLYGGDTGIRDGTYGELRVALASITDDAIRERLTKTVTVRVLPEGADLLVALSDPQRHGPPLSKPAIAAKDLPPGCTRLVPIAIGPSTRNTRLLDPERGGLWIRQRGVDRTELVCSSVRVTLQEGADPVIAGSLNHACTMLSVHYEKHRISHTRNVYQHVYYLEPDGPTPRWHPLEALRAGVVADMERSIMADAWRELEVKLGFRPIRMADKAQRRRKH